MAPQQQKNSSLNNIPRDEADECDADEFKQNEVRVSSWLPAHIGREGRNGPINKSPCEISQKKQDVLPANNVEGEKQETTIIIQYTNIDKLHTQKSFKSSKRASRIEIQPNSHNMHK